MRSGLAALAAMAAVLAPAAAPTQAQDVVGTVTELIKGSDGAGLYMIHGREATGVGLGLEWQMSERWEWLRFDLIAARSNTGHERLIPGVGVRVAGGEGTPDLTLGLCWPPSEYGTARVGGLKTYAAPYIGLQMEL